MIVRIATRSVQGLERPPRQLNELDNQLVQLVANADQTTSSPCSAR